MPDPRFFGLNTQLMKKWRLREYYDAVDVAIGGKMRMVLEINKSSDAYWKFQNNRRALEPKDINLTVDNSAEALLEAFEREQRGEVIDFAEEKPLIIAEDAEFTEVSEQGPAWSSELFDEDED